MNYGGATLGCCVSSRRKKVTVGETGKEGDLLTRSGTRRTTSCQGGIGRVAGNQGVADLWDRALTVEMNNCSRLQQISSAFHE